jgi:hypothetical protein
MATRDVVEHLLNAAGHLRGAVRGVVPPVDLFWAVPEEVKGPLRAVRRDLLMAVRTAIEDELARMEEAEAQRAVEKVEVK